MSTCLILPLGCFGGGPERLYVRWQTFILSAVLSCWRVLRFHALCCHVLSHYVATSYLYFHKNHVALRFHVLMFYVLYVRTF